MKDALWNSLPLPAFIVDFDGGILDANGEAEQFMNAPARRLRGQKVQDILSREAALARAFDGDQVGYGAINVNNIALLGSVDARQGNLKIAPLLEHEDKAVVLVEERRDALLLGRRNDAKSAARSAIGMAEMLAHEIKNPLAGITGAAQLLAMSLSAEDREMTDLIVGESRRIVTLFDQFEQFGNLRPPARKPMNIHDLLDQSMRSAKVGFAAHITFHQVYDPSLPPTYVDGDQIMQVFLNLIKNASEATGDGGEIIFEPGETSIVIGKDGTITTSQGNKDKLRVVSFENPQTMEKQGSSLYASDETPGAGENVTVTQGAYETSNVQSMKQMTEMIETVRAYTSVSRMLEATDETRGKAIEQLGNPAR